MAALSCSGFSFPRILANRFCVQFLIEQPALMIGQTFSHYRIIKELGKGGMGVVYLAEDTVLGRRVAIKMLTDTKGGGNQHFRGRFLREARAVSALSHPHIAAVHDYGETDEGQPYIVMEFVQGETLAELMLKETLTIPRSLKIIKQVAEALSEAHRHGIIHRDIKPSNVAINHRGDVKVLDFGLAKQIDLGSISPADPERQTLLNTQTREGVIVGTPMYLSPEQALGVEVDARSDLFSLGGVMYECIAGKPPFLGSSPIDICAKVIRDNPPPPSELNKDVSNELDRITLKALAKKQEQRYQTADDLIADLDSAQADLQGRSAQTVTRLITPAPETHRSSSVFETLSDIFKRPRLSVGYVAAGLVLLSLIAFVTWRVTRPKLRAPTAEAQRLYDKGVEAIREGAFFRASKLLQQAVQEDDQFALAHARLAEAWTELDSSDKAKDELIRATDLIPDRSVLPEVDSLRMQAVTNTIKRDFPKAVENYQALSSKAAERERAYAFVDLGRAYEKNEQLDKAIESHQQAAKLDSNYAAAFLRLGIVLGRARRFDDAYQAFYQANKLFDIANEIEGMTQVLLQRAVLLGQQGKLLEAREQLLKAHQKSSVLENKDKLILVLLNLSNTAVMAGDATEAEKYSTQALEQARVAGLESLTMQGLIDQGNLFLIKGIFSEAEKRFSEALRLAQLYKGRRSEARALLSLSSLRSQQGDAVAASQYAQQALPFFEQGGYQKETSQAYTLLGRAQQGVGDYKSAKHTFEQQLQSAKQTGDPQSIALAEEGLGGVLSDMQDFPAALQHFNVDYDTIKKLNAKLTLGYVAVNRASVLWQQGQYDKATADLNEALQISEPLGAARFDELAALVHLGFARLNLSKRDFKNSIAESKKALEISGEKFKSINVRAGYTLGLAESYSGQIPAGRKHCEEAVGIARALSNPIHLSYALLAMAETALNAGDAQSALTNAVEAQQRFAAAGQKETEWRSLAIAAFASKNVGDITKARDFGSRASSGLTGLEQQWGSTNYNSYLDRPDIEELLKRFNSLLGPGPALVK